MYDNIKLYFANNSIFALCCCAAIFKRKKILQTLFDEATLRIDKETDLLKIMKTLRNTKILLKNSVMNKDVLFQIAHADKNLINLDDSEKEDAI